jgi:hypothetical protein
MNKHFIKWAQENYKERIERGRTIHPFLSSVRKWADDKIASVYKEHGCPQNFNSIYNESLYQPNFFDRIIFKLEPIYKRIGDLKQIKDKLTSLYQVYIIQRIIDPINIKVDEMYSRINFSTTKNIEEGKPMELNKSGKKSQIISYLQKKQKFKKENSSFSFMGLLLFRSNHTDEYTKLFLEREVEYWRIKNLKFKNSFKGFFMTALEVKRDYVINLKEETRTRRSYQSLTSKIFNIFKYYCFPNIKLNRKFFGRFILGLGLILSFNLRYSLSDPSIVSEYSKENQEQQEIAKLLIVNPNSLKKLIDAIDSNKEKVYIKLIEKEMKINKEIVAMNDNKSNQTENISENNENLPKNEQSGELFTSKILDEYNLNIQVMNTRMALSRVLVTCFPLILSVRQYRRGISKKQTIVKFLLYYYILNEFSIYMAFLEHLNIKNFLAVYSFQEDKNEMQNFLFYKNNLHNIYSIKN